jgi:hypothetical protein
VTLSALLSFFQEILSKKLIQNSSNRGKGGQYANYSTSPFSKKNYLKRSLKKVAIQSQKLFRYSRSVLLISKYPIL